METTAQRDNLRYKKIPLTNRSGVIPAVRFGTLMPDSVDSKKATAGALESKFHQLDSSERYLNENEVGEAMPEVALYDWEPSLGSFLAELLRGLSQCPKSVAAKFLYDAMGSQLFDEICSLDEYYLTRTEMGIPPDFATPLRFERQTRKLRRAGRDTLRHNTLGPRRRDLLIRFRLNLPEGRFDRSLARSAWNNATRKGRPVGYGVIRAGVQTGSMLRV